MHALVLLDFSLFMQYNVRMLICMVQCSAGGEDPKGPAGCEEALPPCARARRRIRRASRAHRGMFASEIK